MSMSDDPRDFRRGQGNGRDYAQQPRQGQGGRATPPADDRYEGYRQPDAPPNRPPAGQDKPAPSFSAYRPEAYANHDLAPPSRSERADWNNGSRNAPPPSRSAPPPPPSRSAPPPQQDPYSRQPPVARDPYYQNAPSDPYAPRSSRGYEPDWERDGYQDAGASRFPSYYPAGDELQSVPDVQSVHDRFFAPDAHTDDLPPPSPAKARVHSGFHDQSYDDRASFDDRAQHGYGNTPTPAYPSDPAPQARNFDDGFDNGQFYDWDKPDQTPPPASVRPFHPPAVLDEDHDADFFADEDDYDTEDYEPNKKGGRKKLMAAVLVGAVVVGGGLAYVYKFSAGAGDGSPSLIVADTSPIKETPSDPGGRDFPNGNKLIYDRLGGDESNSARLASGGDTDTRSELRDFASSAGGDPDPIPGIVTTGGGTLEERIENALKAQGGDGRAAQANPESADKPRTVRTVTFGPDGTPQAAETRTQRIAANAPQSENLSSNSVVVTTAQAISSLSSESSVSESRLEATERNSERSAGGAQIAAISAEPQIPEITESSGGSSGFFVQIGARNDQEAAIAAFATLQQKYASVIGNYPPSVRKADLGAKGVWYRLLIGPVDNKTEADALCEQLKSAGMKGCFSRRD